MKHLEMVRLADRAFFDRTPEVLARALVGCVLRCGEVGGRIVEVEAYLGVDDEASHSVRGMRAAVAALEAGPGTLYVHPMRQYVGVDIVGRGGMVLIRALEPVEGVGTMLERVGGVDETRVANGPGKLCRALGITRAMNGLNVVAEGCPVQVYAGEGAHEIGVGPRVGINRSVGLPLRFTLAGSGFLSRK